MDPYEKIDAFLLELEPCPCQLFYKKIYPLTGSYVHVGYKVIHTPGEKEEVWKADCSRCGRVVEGPKEYVKSNWNVGAFYTPPTPHEHSG